MFYRDDIRIPQAPWIVLLMCLLLFLPWLGEAWFNSKGEPREALVAVSILQQGNWVLPVTFGSDIPYKPPLLAWLIAVFAEIFNGGVVNEYISRLPSATAATALIMAGFMWVRRIRGDRFAMIFSIVTLTCFEVFRAGMACRVDMVLTACMVIPIYMMYRVAERGDKRHRAQDALYYIGATLLLSCAVLTKGPVGSLLPCAVIGLYLLARRHRFLPVFVKMLAVAVAAMVLPSLWYYAAWQHGGDAFMNLAIEENIGRLTGTMSYASHVRPFWYNFVTLAAGCLPWTVAAVFAINSIHKYRRRPLTPAGLLSIVAVAAIVIFYCIPASKRSVYLLPAYPFVCYGIATLIDSTLLRKPVRVFTYLMAVLAVLVPLAFTAILIFGMPMTGVTVVQPHWYGLATLSLPVVAGAAWLVNRHSPVGHLMCIVWSLYVAYIACVMPAVTNALSDKNLLHAIPSDSAVLCMPPQSTGNDLWRPYTLDFYLNDRIRLTESIRPATDYAAGTVIIMPADADTPGLSDNFTVTELTHRGCDYRKPLLMAVKK